MRQSIIPEQYLTFAGNDAELIPIAEVPVPLDLGRLATLELSITKEDLDLIEKWATVFSDVPSDKLPQRFFTSVKFLGRVWTEAGNKNGYYDAVRNLYTFLPEGVDISGSDEWKVIESLYYTTQVAQQGNHLFGMVMETSIIASETEEVTVSKG